MLECTTQKKYKINCKNLKKLSSLLNQKKNLYDRRKYLNHIAFANEPVSEKSKNFNVQQGGLSITLTLNAWAFALLCCTGLGLPHLQVNAEVHFFCGNLLFI
ncbi:hypothetical protein CGC47_07135 [Capnocytophaga canimorsus]|nr:hypothetical protein CGC47_07135 [Capnocytophaga canimorsus]